MKTRGMAKRNKGRRRRERLSEGETANEAGKGLEKNCGQHELEGTK